MRSLLLALGMLLALASTAEAQSTASVIADSEARERAFIDRVWAAQALGRISRWERPRIDGLFHQLDRVQRSIVLDCVVTPRELERLERIHERLDRFITTAVAF